VTKSNPENCKNCSPKCANDFAQLQNIIQHITVLIICPLTSRQTRSELAEISYLPPRPYATWESTLTLTLPWGCMFRRPCRTALPHSTRSAVYVSVFPGRWYCPWWCRWFCSDLTLAMRHSLVSQPTSWADCSLYATPLHDLFYRGASKYDHVTPLLQELHWLRIEQRIEFKLSVLVFRCLNGLAPSYLSRDLLRVSDLAARQRLRSSSTSTLVVPPTRLSTVGDRTFPVAVARTWNSLSRSLTSLSSLVSFRRQLKTELFIRIFPDLDSSAYDHIWQILCSHFASHSRFVTVFSVCKVSSKSFDITPPKSFLSIIIIIIIA